MNGARNNEATHSARRSRGDRAASCSVATFPKAFLCIALSLCIALVPLNAHIDPSFSNVSVQKSEALANPAVIAGAGAALSALALELGISETALVYGICAVGVGATGLAFYNSSRTDVALPGWKPWDDLTPQQKQDWVGQDGTSEDYYNQQIAWWALQAGILEQTPNGGLEPTPEPDPSNDPDGHSNWQKARNVLIALAAGGGAVAFNEAVSPLVDNAAASIKEMLFGGDNVNAGSLDITYQGDYLLGVVDRPMVFITIPTTTYTYASGATVTCGTNQWTYYGPDAGYDGRILALVWNDNLVSNLTGEYQQNSGYKSYYFRNSNTGLFINFRNGEMVGAGTKSSTSFYTPNYNGGNDRTYMNANYSGRYTFPNGDYFENGAMHGSGFTLTDVDYGQMSDTPDGIAQNILNQTNLTQFIEARHGQNPRRTQRA